MHAQEAKEGAPCSRQSLTCSWHGSDMVREALSILTVEG